MKRTPFGLFLAEYRLKNEVLLRDIARLLEVSPSMLSNVEHGRKEIPSSWFDKLCERLSLNLVQSTELKKSIMRSQRSLKITPRDESERELILSFIERQRLDAKP